MNFTHRESRFGVVVVTRCGRTKPNECDKFRAGTRRHNTPTLYGIHNTKEADG